MVRRDVKWGDGVDGDDITEWLRALRRRNMAATTIKRRRITARRLEAWLAERGDTMLDATSDDIATWLDGLRNKHTGKSLAPQSVDHYQSDLVGFYRWATRSGRLDSDPTEWLERRIRPAYLPHPIVSDDLAVALDLADPQMRMILALAALAGLRAAEIAALHVTAVDRGGQTLWVVQGKGAKDRVVPICPALDAELARYGLPRSGPVIHHEGGQYRAQSMSAKASRFLSGCGLGNSLHDLRHWYASTLLDQGVDVRVVQELLGHSSLSSTQIYTRVSRRHLTSAVASLDLPGQRLLRSA